MQLLFGKPVADQILTRLKDEIFSQAKKPGLAVILIGEDEASKIYVNLKEKRAHEIGMNFFRYDLPKNISQQEIIERIEKLNKDQMINGIIVQLPLPQGFETEKIISVIDPEKDADGFHPRNSKLFLEGNGNIWPVFPGAIIKLIKSSCEILDGKNAIVIANSDEFGKIMREALRREKMESQYILSSTLSLNQALLKAADVVVSAVGLPGLLKGEMFKDGAIVVDGGIEKVGEKILGDVGFASTEGKNGFISPVPGGVGPLTIACLLENVYQAFKAQQKEN